MSTLPSQCFPHDTGERSVVSSLFLKGTNENAPALSPNFEKYVTTKEKVVTEEVKTFLTPCTIENPSDPSNSPSVRVFEASK